MPAVSHNVPEAKPIDEGPTRDSLYKNHTLEVRPLWWVRCTRLLACTRPPSCGRSFKRARSRPATPVLQLPGLHNECWRRHQGFL